MVCSQKQTQASFSRNASRVVYTNTLDGVTISSEILGHDDRNPAFFRDEKLLTEICAGLAKPILFLKTLAINRLMQTHDFRTLLDGILAVLPETDDKGETIGCHSEWSTTRRALSRSTRRLTWRRISHAAKTTSLQFPDCFDNCNSLVQAIWKAQKGVHYQIPGKPRLSIMQRKQRWTKCQLEKPKGLKKKNGKVTLA